MMLAVPAIDRFDLLEHGNGADPSDGPDQRMNRALTPEEVAIIRGLALEMPAHRIWKTLFEDICSYHTVRRVANREYYEEQP